MIIFLATAPEHEITGYGDALIDAGHPELLVPFLKYTDTRFNSLRGFQRSRLCTHPCSSRCQFAVDVGMDPQQYYCSDGCRYEQHFPEILANEALIQQRLGEPDAVNADLLSGT